ncbi:YveK family protein [Collinsella tanakaei]|uniref:YveK family protein n=1 Tax=Collinsella tanakaei TaxID=626935 RepID=UPI00195D6E77|nr:Wzz/FepE/Etk N-terminal domain-containing protein [Collinsella tanakaei]MBM6868093.1 lipopolysaccharide biosynthesis protein [Collinsella tanakaei]
MTLLELLTLLRKHLKFVIVLPVVCAVAMFFVAYFMMADEYTAVTSMYVLASSEDQGGSALSTDLSASQMITNDVATLLTSNRVVADAAQELGLENLGDFDISVSSETTTRVLSVSVTGENPVVAADIANALATNVSSIAQEVMNVESVNIVDLASVPNSPSGPNRVLYVAVAFMAGLLAAVAIVVLVDMLNTRVRNAEQVEELLGLPVIGRIPQVKGGR